jgi:hypothetical protein
LKCIESSNVLKDLTALSPCSVGKAKLMVKYNNHWNLKIAVQVSSKNFSCLNSKCWLTSVILLFYPIANDYLIIVGQQELKQARRRKSHVTLCLTVLKQILQNKTYRKRRAFEQLNYILLAQYFHSARQMLT